MYRYRGTVPTYEGKHAKSSECAKNATNGIIRGLKFNTPVNKNS